MSDDASARLGLPYLAAGQLQKHVTLNEALTRLGALTQMAVVSRTTVAQPTAPADGALYILPTGATGAFWAGRPAGSLLRAEAGGWIAVAAPNGLLAVVLDSDEVLVRRAGTWAPLSSGEAEPVKALQNLTRLGVNTEADAANVFSARLNKALWTALESENGGDGDLRFTFNKQGASDVLSLLFQSGWGGRAELGLIGDDDLRLKVSADGTTWRDAFSVERATGRVTFARGAAREDNSDGQQQLDAACLGAMGRGGLRGRRRRWRRGRRGDSGNCALRRRRRRGGRRVGRALVRRGADGRSGGGRRRWRSGRHDSGSQRIGRDQLYAIDGRDRASDRRER